MKAEKRGVRRGLPRRFESSKKHVDMYRNEGVKEMRDSEQQLLNSWGKRSKTCRANYVVSVAMGKESW
jgi:hypothetical protein